jgi:hypothetical protein
MTKRTIILSDDAWESLKLKAQQRKMIYNHEPSASELIRAIASDEVFLDLPLSPEEQSALLRAIVAMHQASAPQSQIETLVSWVLKRSEVSANMKAQFSALASQFSDWRTQAENFIAQFQPFTLTYKGETWTVLYAKISDAGVGDRRPYLHAWVEELGENSPNDPLAHNRTFLLDASAAVTATQDKLWRHSGLDTIELVFEVSFSYRPKPEDIRVEPVTVSWMQEEKNVMRVTRRIDSFFWTSQDLDRYGDGCRIISPNWAVNRTIATLKNRISLYY